MAVRLNDDKVMLMIIEEMVGDRIRHYSDKNMKIRQIETGIVYDDAVDIYPCPYNLSRY